MTSSDLVSVPLRYARALEHYRDTLEAFGTVPQGVGWSSPAAQQIRFAQLAKLWEGHDEGQRRFTLNDYGCGYGALLGFLQLSRVKCAYRGYDPLPEMVCAAQGLYPTGAFTMDLATVEPADFAVASGVFNVKHDVPDAEWLAYTEENLDVLARLGTKGFAFNMITHHVDYRVPELYYADPLHFFELCRSKYSKRVALLHDYPLYDFTVVVRYD